MKKVTIVGITSSGKTCYFYGMMRTMTRGIHGFALRLMNTDDFDKINQGMKRLADYRMDLSERFPQPSGDIERYDMELMYNYNGLTEFQWTDYPGEITQKSTKQFIELLDDTSCLLLCVDGELIQGTGDDIEDIIGDINMASGMALNSALLQAANKNGSLPPVCVVVTKYDKVSPELRSEDSMTEIIRGVFPNLFHAGNGGTMVMICPVSLGADIMNGGRLRPKNMEKPICFANYVMVLEAMRNYISAKNAEIEKKNAAIQEYNSKGFFGRLISTRPQPMTEEEKQVIESMLSSMKEILASLRGEIDIFKLYVNGEKTDWPE